MDWIKPGEVLAEVRQPKEGWPTGAIDLIKTIAAQEGINSSKVKFKVRKEWRN
jgi:hypothetical protein